MPLRTTERINFGKIKEIIAPPNLIELQTNSYREFFAGGSASVQAKESWFASGLHGGVSRSRATTASAYWIFIPMKSGSRRWIGSECLREGLTYGAPLYVTFMLKEEKGTKEEKVFMGELPLMTPSGNLCHQRCRASDCQPTASFAWVGFRSDSAS
jgi:DNA-directed RNA polymerase subunit beta